MPIQYLSGLLLNIAILDSKGEVVVKYVYDAWGTCKASKPDGSELADLMHIGNLNPFRYRGYYYDTETKLYYLKTRYYDPQVGRFITIDDFSYLDPEHINGLNLYAYCADNPVMNVDENGTRWSLANFLKALAVIVMTTAAVVVLAAVTICTFGIGTAVATGILVGALVGGIVAGGVNLAMQVATNGWENIDYFSLGVSTFFGGVAGAISGGLGAMVPAVTGTQLLVQKAFQGVLNAVISATVYILQSAISGSDITFVGFGTAVLGGFVSGMIFDKSASVSFAVSVGIEIASYYEDIWLFIKKKILQK